MQNQTIYLDNNATTMVAPEVVDAMKPYFSENYGNPSSVHYPLGMKVNEAVQNAREQVAKFLNVKRHEIVFASSGTESNNTAIRSVLQANPSRKKIVITNVEHASIRNLCRKLGEEGYEIVSIGVSKSGALDFNQLESVLSEDVAIVSVMWANNETGVIFPIDQIVMKVKKYGILFHVDAVQVAGKIKIDLSSLPVDFLSISAHKFHGPKGIGALFVRYGTPFFPLLIGGGQERNCRAGTENVPGIVGFGTAAKIASQALEGYPINALGCAIDKRGFPMPLSIPIPITNFDDVFSYGSGARSFVEYLRNILEGKLRDSIPESFINGKNEDRIPNTINITIPGIEIEPFLIQLSRFGIMASSGSACSTGALEPSHVLMAMGHSRDLALSSIRLSLSCYTTWEEIDRAIKIIPRVALESRKLNKWQPAGVL